MTRGQNEATPSGAEVGRMLAWLLPGLPPDEQTEIGRELAREARDTYAARRVPPPLWVSEITGEGR